MAMYLAFIFSNSGSGPGFTTFGSDATLSPQLVVDHVVDLIEPLARVASQRMRMNKVCGAGAAVFTGQNVFHLIEHIVRMG
jgi:hypothetical protein